jgi:hypothetical protein
VTVALQIRQRIAIGGAEMHIELHMSLNSAFITKSGTSKKVVNVIVPGDRESIGGRGDLNPKEVANMTKISHEKLLTETGLDKGNVFRVVTSDDHVINIEKKKSPTTRRCVYKYHKIMCARKKASCRHHRGKTLKIGARGLLKAIEGALETTDHAIRNRIPWSGCIYTSSRNLPLRKAL